MTNEELSAVMDDLRNDVQSLNGNLMLPSAVKFAVNNTFRVLSEVVARIQNGQG